MRINLYKNLIQRCQHISEPLRDSSVSAVVGMFLENLNKEKEITGKIDYVSACMLAHYIFPEL